MLAVDNYILLRSPEDVSLGIAQRIAKRRKEKKLAQAALAGVSDVSLGSIKRSERTGEISLSSLVKIAFVLGIESGLDHLFEKRVYNSIEEIINEK